jgi:hypothetical protein
MPMNHQIYRANTSTNQPHQFINVTREWEYNRL